MTDIGFCPACGVARVEGTRFCAGCGADLSTASADEFGRHTTAAGSEPDPVPVAGWRAGTHTPRAVLLVLGAAALVVVGVFAAAVSYPDLLGSVTRPASCLTIEYRILPIGDRRPTSSDAAVIRDILDRRLWGLGSSDHTVQVAGSERIVVGLPCGLPQEGSIAADLGRTGAVAFVPIPAGSSVTEGQQIDLGKYPPLFGGESIASASLGKDALGNDAIDFTLDAEAATKLASYTTANVGNQFAIVLDGSIVTAPVIQSPITTGTGQITAGAAGFTRTQANDLLTVIEYGSLPFPMERIVTGAAVPAGTALLVFED